MPRPFRFRPLAGPALLAFLLVGCAHGGERLDRVAITDVAQRDPWEKTNRRIFRVSMEIDRYALRPITDAYRFAVPEAPRRGIRNAYDLFQEPTHMANAVAQGKVKSAFRAADRILINGLLGMGVADHASDMGLPAEEHDFGQTLAVWGVPSGPFMMLPFLGPSTARDSVGFFVDFLLDPMDYVDNRVLAPDEQLVKLSIRVLDIRSGLRDQGEQLLAGAADPYATTRSAWLQLRRYEIFDGNLPDTDPDDIPPPPDEPPATDSASEAAPEPAIPATPLPSVPPAADSATAPSTPAAADPDPVPRQP